MAKHRVTLIILILVSTFLGSAGARIIFTNHDFIIPGDEAGRFLASGKLPEKAGVSNLGSYIAPGVSWLEVPGVALHRPLFLQLPSAIALYVLTLVGLYLLGTECAGPWTGCAAVALFGFYRNGMYWAQSIRPRAFPVCYVWIALMVIWWVARRRPRYLFGALLILLLGLSVHLELIFASLPIAIIWLWFRPPVGKWPIPLALICSGIVWLHYFHFEAGRHFEDLRSQLFVQSLPGLDANAAFPGMLEHYDAQSHNFIPASGRASDMTTRRTLREVIEDIVPSGYSNFYTSRLIATMLVPIGLTLAASLHLVFPKSWPAWAGERHRSIALLCLSLGVPWLMLSIMVPPTFLVRHWGLLPLQCVAACVGASFLASRPHTMWVAIVLVGAWIVTDARMSVRVVASIAREGWAGDECAEAKICDLIAMDRHSPPLCVGYSLAFKSLESISQVPGEPTEKIGVSFDRYLRWRYGIENRSTSLEGFDNNDQYRVLQDGPFDDGACRFKSNLDGFAKIAQVGKFELWKRQTAAWLSHESN